MMMMMMMMVKLLILVALVVVVVVVASSSPSFAAHGTSKGPPRDVWRQHGRTEKCSHSLPLQQEEAERGLGTVPSQQRKSSSDSTLRG
jgi:hypothetical protein